MGKKDPNLCERPYCRETWKVEVNGFDERFGGRRWKAHFCNEHAKPYQSGMVAAYPPYHGQVHIRCQNRPEGEL